MSAENTHNVIEVFNNCAKQYEEKFLDDSRYNSIYYLFCDLLKKKNPKVLEVGCGPGNTTNALLKIRPDFEVLGIDLSPNMIELAKKNNPKADFQLLDAREIGALNKKFDAVVCSFCLPYLNKEDALSFIENVSKLIQRVGCFISVLWRMIIITPVYVHPVMVERTQFMCIIMKMIT